MKRQYIIPAVYVKHLQMEHNILVGSPTPKDDTQYVIGPQTQSLSNEALTNSDVTDGSLFGTIKPATDNGGSGDQTNGSY